MTPDPDDGLRSFLRHVEHRVRETDRGTLVVLIRAEEGVMLAKRLHESRDREDVARVMREMPRRK